MGGLHHAAQVDDHIPPRIDKEHRQKKVDKGGLLRYRIISLLA
jgi:hypothetical protein